MFLQILALAAAMAPAPDAPPSAAPPTSTVSPVTVSPSQTKPNIAAQVDVAGGEDASHRIVAFWPTTAYRAGVDGQVTLSCLIDTHGLAEHCNVASETPPNLGFGKAALQLRPSFKLKPATGANGQPVDATMSISVSFKAPGRDFDIEGFERTIDAIGRRPVGDHAEVDIPGSGNSLAMREVTMIADPVWTGAPGFDDLAAAYPAKGAGAEGYADARCGVERSGAQAGALSYCKIIKESPEGRDFGKAALTLTSRFRLAPEVLAKAPRAGQLRVDVPIRLPPPAELRGRVVRAPIWTQVVDADALSRAFPPQAAAIGLHSGLGVAHCTVAPDGTMAACVAEAGEPNGYGFSEAAARLATTMKVNLWSADGAPVEGGVVQIPLRFDGRGAN